MTIFNSKLLVYQRVAPFHWQWIDHKVPKVPGQGSGRDAQGTIQGLLPFRSVSDPVFILDVKHLGVDHSSANVQVVEGGQKIEIHIQFLESARKSTWLIGESARNSYEML